MYLEVLKQEEKFGLCFWSLHDRKKGTTKAFNSFKLTRKPFLVYLQVKLEQIAATVVFSHKNARKR